MLGLDRIPYFGLSILGGWLLFEYRPDAARKAAAWFSVIAIGFLFVLAWTGFGDPNPQVVRLHRWTGHLFMIDVWLTVPAAIVVAVRRAGSRRVLRAVAHTITLLTFVGFSLLCSFTGYLKPRDEEIGNLHLDEAARRFIQEETANRFFVLHMIALPTLLVVLAIVWLWVFRLRTDEGEH